jgi:hypothetical protein
MFTLCQCFFRKIYAKSCIFPFFSAVFRIFSRGFLEFSSIFFLFLRFSLVFSHFKKLAGQMHAQGRPARAKRRRALRP